MTEYRLPGIVIPPCANYHAAIPQTPHVPMPVRVALVEDNPALRRRLVERLCFFDELSLVFATETVEACLKQLQALSPEARPKIILMDIELPGISGIDTTALVKETDPGIDVLMLTVFEQEDKIFASIQAGASGYLLKDASTEAIIRAVQELVEGGAPMSPAVARKMLHFVRSAPAPEALGPSQTFSLSARELELLEHLVRDETEAGIADALFISPHTVRTHIKNIYKKLHVHSRASAVRMALEHRLLS